MERYRLLNQKYVERTRKKAREYYRKHRPKFKATDATREATRKQDLLNYEDKLKRRRDWQQRNKDWHNEYQRKWREKHKEYYNAKCRNRQIERRGITTNKQMEKYLQNNQIIEEWRKKNEERKLYEKEKHQKQIGDHQS